MKNSKRKNQKLRRQRSQVRHENKKKREEREEHVEQAEQSEYAYNIPNEGFTVVERSYGYGLYTMKPNAIGRMSNMKVGQFSNYIDAVIASHCQ